MTEVRDIARIRDISNKSLDQEIPDIEDPEVLKDAAQLVHTKLVRDKITPASPERKRNGLPGKRWQGRIINDVMYKLWPRLADRMLISEERSRAITGRIMSYLTQCGMLHCEQKTTRFNAAVWWVSDHWTPMDVRQVEDDDVVDVEIAEEHEDDMEHTPPIGELPPGMSIGDGEVFRCRVCKTPYPSRQGRGGHEFSTHRVVVDANDKVWSYDDPKYTPRFIVDALMRILEAAGKPLSFNAMAGLAYEIDPRMGKPDIRKALDALEESHAVRATVKGQRVLYDLISEDISEEEFDTMMASGKPVELDARPVQTQAFITAVAEAAHKQPDNPSGLAPVPTDFPSSVAFVRHITRTAHGALQKVLDATEEMERFAAAKEQEIAGLRQRLMATANTAEVAKLKADLAAVTAERDDYKAKLDNLSKALSGLGFNN